jgi:hypothetical protein
MTTKEKQIQDLPWWTAEELEGAALFDEIYLDSHPPAVVDWQIAMQQASASDNINWMYFRSQILDKYRTHKYCDIGHDYQNECEYVRFLSTDKSKPPDSAVRFRFESDNVQILKVKAADYINIPPRQRQHWDQHAIPENQVKMK